MIIIVSKTFRNDGLEGRPTTIASGVDWYIDPANRTCGGVQDYMAKFEPFNSLFVRNNDANEIYVDPNSSPQRRIVLPQGSTVTVLNEPFFHLKIHNNGTGTIVQGNITVKIEKIIEKRR